MSTLSIKLPKGIDEKLTTTAKRRNKAKTTLVVEALKEYLAKEDEEAIVSAYDLAKEFLGCGEGPSDLSTNKKYMEGYGQ